MKAQVVGLKETLRDLNKLDKELSKEIRKDIRKTVKPLLSIRNGWLTQRARYLRLF